MDDLRQVLRNNQRIQLQNGVPADFPIFVREGFAVKVRASRVLGF